ADKKYLENKDVIAVRSHDIPLLFKQSLKDIELSWVAGIAPADKFRCAAKDRYRQKDQSCEVEVNQDGSVNVTFDQPQRAITPGQ
ncbi:aminomethyltransferase beta-barrel domain-containing protein, partial [Francisella tularensis]|uniref:aminomethyltransferase beta-barrel domain-containing protein n=1 Tax=Francisella tularensis TaxID=263 RepID=UPI00198B6C13